MYMNTVRVNPVWPLVHTLLFLFVLYVRVAALSATASLSAISVHSLCLSQCTVESYILATQPCVQKDIIKEVGRPRDVNSQIVDSDSGG